MSSWEKVLSPTCEITCWNSCCASSKNTGPTSQSSRVQYMLIPSAESRGLLPASASISCGYKNESALTTASLEIGPQNEERIEKLTTVSGAPAYTTAAATYVDIVCRGMESNARPPTPRVLRSLEQCPNNELPAIVHHLSETPIASSLATRVSIESARQNINNVKDTKGLPLLGKLVSKKPAADRARSEPEHEKHYADGMDGGNKETVTADFPQATDEYLSWKDLARGLVSGGIDDFLATHSGGRKVFHNFVYRRRKFIVPKRKLDLPPAVRKAGNPVTSASRPRMKLPRSSACDYVTEVERHGDFGSRDVRSSRRRLGCLQQSAERRRISSKKIMLPTQSASKNAAGVSSSAMGRRFGSRHRLGWCADKRRPLKCQRCGSSNVWIFERTPNLRQAAARRDINNLPINEIPRQLETIPPSRDFAPPACVGGQLRQSLEGERKPTTVSGKIEPGTLRDADRQGGSGGGWKRGWRYRKG